MAGAEQEATPEQAERADALLGNLDGFADEVARLVQEEEEDTSSTVHTPPQTRQADEAEEEPTLEDEDGERVGEETSTPERDSFLSSLDPVLAQTARRAHLPEGALERMGDLAEPFLQQLKQMQDQTSALLGRMGQQATEDPQQPQRMGTEPNPQQAQQAADQLDQMRNALPEEVVKALDVELDPALHGDELVQVVNALRDGYRQMLGQVGPMSQQAQAAAEQKLVQLADEFFGQLREQYPEDGFAEQYGEKSLAELPPDSPQFEAQATVLRLADRIATSAQQVGVQMTPQEAMERAFSLMHKEHDRNAARKEVNDSLTRRRGQFIQRPTRRRTRREALSEEERATHAAAEAMEDLGLDTYDWE